MFPSLKRDLPFWNVQVTKIYPTNFLPFKPVVPKHGVRDVPRQRIPEPWPLALLSRAAGNCSTRITADTSSSPSQNSFWSLLLGITVQEHLGPQVLELTVLRYMQDLV